MIVTHLLRVQTLPLLPSLQPGEFLLLAEIWKEGVGLFILGRDVDFVIFPVFGIDGFVLGCVCVGCEGQCEPWGGSWVQGGSCLCKAWHGRGLSDLCLGLCSAAGGHNGHSPRAGDSGVQGGTAWGRTHAGC